MVPSENPPKKLSGPEKGIARSFAGVGHARKPVETLRTLTGVAQRTAFGSS